MNNSTDDAQDSSSLGDEIEEYSATDEQNSHFLALISSNC